MEPITHFLTGGCLARAGLNRTTALATTTLVLAAEAPDIDIVWLAKGPVFYFAHHRGFTHTFIGAPFVAAAVVALVYVLWRIAQHFAKPDPMGCAGCPPGSPPAAARRPRWGVLYLLAVFSCFVHILLDYTNSYGVRPFMPFSYRWHSWDIVSIFEPLMWLFLLAGLILPGLFRLVNEEIGAKSRGPHGRVGAILALVAIVALWGYRDYEHRRALTVMNSLMFHGEEATRVSAYPYDTNPYRWHCVAETHDFFDMMIVNSWTGDFDSDAQARIRYKPEETPVTLAAKKTYLGRVYLDWAQYPMVEEVQLPDGNYEVRFYDLRYSYPERGSVLRASVILDKDLHEVEERFGRRVQKVR